MKKIYISCFLLFIMLKGFSQDEQLVPLNSNAKLEFNQKKGNLTNVSQRQNALLSLPFIEDFNYDGPYPDINLWQDSLVYINNTYPINPPSLGVATFDGLNATGNQYSLLNVAGPADYLTVQPLALGGLTEDSLVFISFFYQPMGLGQKPEAGKDYLKLEFLNQSAQWIEKWSVTGDSSRDFRQEFVKITNDYLYDGFQFRFRNIAQLSGNNDHFHLDYVVVDKNRDTTSDKSPKDMAFQSGPISLLKNYFAMPYFHFDTSELTQIHQTSIRNNFTNTTTDFLDNFEAKELKTNTVFQTYLGTSADLGPLSNNISNYPRIDIPDNLSGDTIIIRLTHNYAVSAEVGSDPKIIANNTIIKDQIFSNYFAYDDASAERGYRLASVAGAKIATRFVANKLDSLQGIKVHFANLNTDNKNGLLSVIVWKKIGPDEEILYQEDLLRLDDFRKINGLDAVNDFSFYDLKPQYIKNGTSKIVVEGEFYVGLLFTDRDKWTIGYDLNTNGSANQFYNVGNGWNPTQFAGSLLLNPLMGEPLPWELTPVVNTPNKSLEIKVFPNPTHNVFFVKGILNASQINIHNLNGQLMQTNTLNTDGQIRLNDLAKGIYFINIIDLVSNASGVSKLIVE